MAEYTDYFSRTVGCNTDGAIQVCRKDGISRVRLYASVASSRESKIAVYSMDEKQTRKLIEALQDSLRHV